VYTQVLFKIKSAVRNRNYTGKTHLRGLKIRDFQFKKYPKTSCSAGRKAR